VFGSDVVVRTWRKLEVLDARRADGAAGSRGWAGCSIEIADEYSYRTGVGVHVQGTRHAIARCSAAVGLAAGGKQDAVRRRGGVRRPASCLGLLVQW